MMNIGKNISTLRKEKGLTQAELARKIKKDRTIVTKYESGAVEVSASMALILAKALHVPISEIFKDSRQSA